MGSGSSKEKSQKTGPVVVAKSDNNSKPTRPQNIENKRNEGTKNTGGKPQVHSQRIESPKAQRNVSKSQPAKRNVGHIEIESESDGEDIADIIAATKRENDNRVQEQNNYNATKDSAYPETYAQRLQREQHQQQLTLMRQKTIYRNPDEWAIEEKEHTDFDVRKFKEANAASNIQSRDIYSSNNNEFTKGPDFEPDFYHSQPPKNEALPKYDMSEEALLAEIEKEYDF